MVTALERPTVAVATAPAPRELPGLEQRLQQRRRALQSLDLIIAPRLRRLLPAWMAWLPVNAAFTPYDAIYPASPAIGGHWIVAARQLGWFTHSVWSYTILACFDDEDRLVCLRVRGKVELVSADCSVEGIDRLLTEAAAQGPAYTFAAPAFSGISL